jgi:hypothetical protein
MKVFTGFKSKKANDMKNYVMIFMEAKLNVTFVLLRG